MEELRNSPLSFEVTEVECFLVIGGTTVSGSTEELDTTELREATSSGSGLGRGDLADRKFEESAGASEDRKMKGILEQYLRYIIEIKVKKRECDPKIGI